MNSALALVNNGIKDHDDPIKLLEAIPNIVLAIELAQTPDEISGIRSMVKTFQTYLKETLPGVMADRNEAMKHLHKTATLWLESCAKAGDIWQGLEDKQTHGGDRKSKNQRNNCYVDWHKAGFKSRQDLQRCIRAADLDEDERWQYYEECRVGFYEPTLSGIEVIWKEFDKARKREQDEEIIASLPDERFQIILSDITNACEHIEAESIDHIVTDPPYPKEYLHVYQPLAKLAIHALKPGGTLAVMIGQSYLPQVLQSLLIDGLRYHWTLAYLTPGPATKIWNRNVNCGWKPVLWLVKGDDKPDWIIDITTSDNRDKDYHEWGQSESGMDQLIDRITRPGQIILDPFLGGGTTGISAVKLGRLFIGMDNDPKVIEKAEKRYGKTSQA